MNTDIRKFLIEIIDLVERYLGGSMPASNLVREVKQRYWEVEDELPEDCSGEAALFRHIFWAVILLEEPEEHRTKDGELDYLVRCARGERSFNKQDIAKIYEKKLKKGGTLEKD